MSENYVRILGARGSAPVSGEQFREFGGATSCVLVKLSGHCIVLDAGSGICSLPAELPGQEELDLILTHLHLDHLIGLPLCPFLLKEGNRMNIHAAVQGKMNLQSLLDRVIGPPYWPVTLDELPAEIKFCSLKEDSLINGIHVETMQGVHPGGISILKLRAEEKTVVRRVFACAFISVRFHGFLENKKCGTYFQDINGNHIYGSFPASC